MNSKPESSPKSKHGKDIYIDTTPSATHSPNCQSNYCDMNGKSNPCSCGRDGTSATTHSLTQKVLSATPDMEGLREEIAKELGCPTSDGTLCSCEKCQSEYLLKASQILSLIQQSVLASKDELIAFYKMQANSWQSEYRKANEKIAKLEADRDTAISEVTKWSGKAGFNEALLDLANEKISKLQSQLLEARKEIERLKK